MNKSIKKFGTVMLSGTMLFSAAGAAMSQTAFAGQLDKIIEVKAIKQLPNWCWIDSAHMMLRQYLEDNGKLSEGESIYEKYGDKCITEANNYYMITGENFTKSKDEFDQLYKKIFIEKTLSLGVALGNSPTEQQKKQVKSLQSIRDNLNDNKTDKDAAFLVYLSSEKLNSSSYRDVFTVHDGNAIQAAVSIVLRAAGMGNENCYIAQFCAIGASNADNADYKLGILDYSLNRNSVVASGTGKVKAGGHFKIINGIKDDKVCVQETGGGAVSEEVAKTYLSTQEEFIFIDNNFGLKSDGTLDGIWFIDPDKNKDGYAYEKGDKIRVGLAKDVDSIKLVNNDNKDKYLIFKKVKDESRIINGTCFDFRDVCFYETELTEGGLKISDLKTDYHFDESAK